MKKIYLFFFFIVIQKSFAQNTFPTSGNAGIGTTTPIAPFEVWGSSGILGRFRSVNGIYTESSFLEFQNGRSIIGYDGTLAGIRISTSDAGKPIVFGNNVSASIGEFARFTGSGKLGIGTITPLSLLHISGNLGNAAITLQRPGYGSGGALGSLGFANGAGNYISSITAHHINTDSTDGVLVFRVGKANASAYSLLERMRIDKDGNVGIGTSSPSYPLQVQGDLAMGSTANNSVSSLIILGPNSPANNGSKRDISFQFLSAGKAQIRAYRGSSWDTYLQFLTTPSSGGSPVERLHIAGDGKIGLGTITPAYKLDVNGDIRINKGSALRLFRSDSTTNGLNIYSASSNNFIHSFTGGLIQISSSAISLDATSGHNFRNYDGSSTFMTISNTGNVGIGVVAPTKRLELGGSRPIVFDTGVGTMKMKADGGGWAMNYGFKGSSDTDWGGLWGYGSADALNQWSIGKSYLDNFLVVKNSGQIGIGTTTIPTDYKLAVAGNIIAEKVKVKKQVGGVWPDYVFSPNYKLPSLEEIEQFTKQNSHLPEIPSAKEVEKEGQDLGEMNRLLLKKVEELTLYMIEQSKEIKSLKAKVEQLEKK